MPDSKPMSEKKLKRNESTCAPGSICDDLCREVRRLREEAAELHADAAAMRMILQPMRDQIICGNQARLAEWDAVLAGATGKELLKWALDMAGIKRDGLIGLVKVPDPPAFLAGLRMESDDE